MNKLVKKALSRAQQGNSRGAEELYKKALRGDPDDVDANYLLGALYAERGDLERALRHTERAARAAPRSPYVQNNLGNIHRMRGDLEQARVCFERAIEFDPMLAEAYNNLGVVVKRLGDNTRAARLYQDAIDRQPLFSEAHFNLGKALWDDGQHDMAAASFRRVIELVPHHAQALDALGTYHLERNEHAAARECFTLCLAANSGDPFGAQLKLAYMDEQAPPEKFPEEWVRQTYETKARTWDADAARPDHEFLGPRHVREAFERWAGSRAGMDILDLGCGTGACGEFLRPRAHHLVGVDLSSAMLQVARQKNLYDELHAADIAAWLATVASRYDAIVASGVLIFFGDLTSLFKAIQRVLNPGGVFIFSTYRAQAGDYSVRANFHFAHSEDYLRRIAAAAGLEVARVDAAVHEIDHGVAQEGYLVELHASA